MPADTLMQEIDAEVNTVRNCDEWRREYMTLALEMDRKYAEGKAEWMLRLAISMWKKGKLTESEAAEEAGVSLDGRGVRTKNWTIIGFRKEPSYVFKAAKRNSPTIV